MERQINELNKLKKIRIENNISCGEIAKMLEISKTYYWQLEKGVRRLNYELAKKIANIFKLKPDDIFYGDL